MRLRVGIGYDIHRLKEGLSCMLGGIEIPFEKGMEGHSDADVLLHAICDAIFGALGEDDIGVLFPDTDPRYKGVSSTMFLEEAKRRAASRDMYIVNIDCVVISEEPRISPYREDIKRSISAILGISQDVVSVKGKTGEGVGPIGKGEAVAVQAVVLLAGKAKEE